MKKKNIFRKPPGERPLAVRIIAIIIVLLLALSMVVTMLPAFVFGEEAVEVWNEATRRGGESWNETAAKGIDTSSLAGAVVHLGENQKNEEGRPILLFDGADLLTASEEQELLTGLEAFRAEQDFDIVVLTVYSLDGYGVVEYADRFFDENGYGGGDDYDGALIIVSTENRDWTMITSGYGITAITDYSLDDMEDAILPELSGGNYLKAFETFADKCAYCVREARKGNIIDEYIEEPSGNQGSSSQGGAQSKGRFPWAVNAGLSGIIGIVSSWFVNGRKKAELKTVRNKNQAKDYMRAGSLELTDHRDRFLYSSMSRTPIRKDDDDSKGHFRGSTIHRAPSGRIHGGGRAGKF